MRQIDLVCSFGRLTDAVPLVEIDQFSMKTSSRYVYFHCVVCAEKPEGEEEQKPSEAQEEGAGNFLFILTQFFAWILSQLCRTSALKLYHLPCIILHV